VLRGGSARYAFAMRRDTIDDALGMQRALVARVGFADLVADVGTIGALSPARVARLDDPINLLEYVVHHEDVRRAQPGWAPRALPAGRQLAIWRMLRGLTRTVGRRAVAGLRLEWDGGDPQALHGADPRATVLGDPVELALVAMGRARAARITVLGDATALLEQGWVPPDGAAG
jgi:uncharacterized protein (TIGR03085 family)